MHICLCETAKRKLTYELALSYINRVFQVNSMISTNFGSQNETILTKFFELLEFAINSRVLQMNLLVGIDVFYRMHEGFFLMIFFRAYAVKSML